MKMKHKLLILKCLAIVTAMLLSLLTGCAPSEPDNEPEVSRTGEDDAEDKTEREENDYPEENTQPEESFYPEDMNHQRTNTVTIAEQVYPLDTEELTLNSLYLTGEDWEGIRRLEKLHSLTLSSVSGGWKVLKSFSGITELTITGCELTDRDWSEVGKMSWLKKLAYDSSIDDISPLLVF